MTDELIVKQNSWHYRVYVWWLEKSGSKPNYNLCPYMRAVMIWAPLHGLLALLEKLFDLLIWPIMKLSGKRGRVWLKAHGQWVVLALFACYATWLLVELILEEGWLTALLIVFGVVGGLALLIGFFIAVLVAGDYISERRRRRSQSGEPGAKGSSGVGLGWAWIKAKKKKICPPIKIEP